MAQRRKIEKSITSSFRLLAFFCQQPECYLLFDFLVLKRFHTLKNFYDNDDQIKIELLIYQLTYKTNKDIF